jgi:GNAT superfamily N-acetyltransferase
MTSHLRYLNLRQVDSTERRRLIEKFYNEIYRNEFLNANLAEHPDIWLRLMGDVVPMGQPMVHVVLACESTGDILGGVVFEQYRESGCWLLTYLAVHKHSRRQGLASSLLDQVKETIRLVGGTDDLLLLEAKSPLHAENQTEHELAVTRLKIFDRLGIQYFPIDYVQPALAPGKYPLADFLLLLYCKTPIHNEIATSRIITFLKELYTSCGQANSEHLRRMCGDLERQSLVTPTPLLTWFEEHNR